MTDSTIIPRRDEAALARKWRQLRLQECVERPDEVKPAIMYDEWKTRKSIMQRKRRAEKHAKTREAVLRHLPPGEEVRAAAIAEATGLTSNSVGATLRSMAKAGIVAVRYVRTTTPTGTTELGLWRRVA